MAAGRPETFVSTCICRRAPRCIRQFFVFTVVRGCAARKRQYKSWGPWLAERGYAVVAVDYRLSSQVSPAWPGVWEDICRALDWLVAQCIIAER